MKNEYYEMKPNDYLQLCQAILDCFGGIDGFVMQLKAVPNDAKATMEAHFGRLAKVVSIEPPEMPTSMRV
jgi:hypothetical protein